LSNALERSRLPPNRYFPLPESQGGWRWLVDAEKIRTLTGIDLNKLEILAHAQERIYGGDSWGLVIIRHGYLVFEYYTFNVLAHTRFDVWSSTKSFTGTAWGMLLEDSRDGRLPVKFDLDSLVYEFIPEGHPLTDPRKKSITLRHLLSMTSGIAGEQAKVIGMPSTTDTGPFEHALGRCPNRYGLWVDRLAAEPGTYWDYSDAAFVHLTLAFAHAAGRELADYLDERLFVPIGIENLSWDVQGGSGFLGPHTNPHTGVHISAREFARFGYLMLNRGMWRDQQLVPVEWIELATRTSQVYNPAYGYTWWVNTKGQIWPELPRDTFAARGYRANVCYVVPSLDLVVARVGSGPTVMDERGLMARIIEAIDPDFRLE
jgi:CubicO group peptidase (beta-lactamase class C family)